MATWELAINNNMTKNFDKLNVALYVGAWPQNIGNAFFDLGLEAIINAAFPSANVFYTGGAVHWMFNHSKKNKKKSIFAKLTRNSETLSSNSFEIAQYANVDLVIVPGMCIAKEFVDNNGKTFLDLAKRKIPVLYVGAGALEYTDEEAAYYVKFLNKFHKYGIITRDSDTFNTLHNQGVKSLEKGIDCALFLPDRYTPPTLSLSKFNIENFDSGQDIPNIDHKDALVLRTHHDCWGPLREVYTKEKNTLVSDVPFDYLALYANVNETYSDRVHACLATLAYGNKARLFSKTPRASLFKELGVANIKQELLSLDMELLKKLKDKQIETVRRMIYELL